MAEFVTYAPVDFVPPEPCPRCFADLPPRDHDGRIVCPICEYTIEPPVVAGQTQDTLTATYLGSLDLGQRQDPSAFLAIRSDGNPQMHEVLDIKRLPIGTPYPSIRDYVADAMHMPILRDSPLIVDATGPGIPMLDFLREDQRLQGRVVGLCITPGRAIRWDASTRCWYVAKSHLAGILQSVLGDARLEVLETCKYRDVLKSEMQSFTHKITQKGVDVFEHASDSLKDDTVLALCIALFWLERGRAAVEVFTAGK